MDAQTFWVEGFWADGFWAANFWAGDAPAPVVPPYSGKYRQEWSGALADVGAARGFAAEHASALADVGGAGR